MKGQRATQLHSVGVMVSIATKLIHCRESIQRLWVNEWPWLCSKKTWWKQLALKFHIIFMCHEVVFSWFSGIVLKDMGHVKQTGLDCTCGLVYWPSPYSIRYPLINTNCVNIPKDNAVCSFFQGQCSLMECAVSRSIKYSTIELSKLSWLMCSWAISHKNPSGRRVWLWWN